VLGAVVPDALGQDAVQLIMQGLVQTIRQPEGTSSPLESLNAPAPPLASPDHPPG
jgi:hypothetical protein